MGIDVLAGRRNGQQRRLITLRSGTAEFRDLLNTDSAWQREQLLERAAARFDVPAEEMLTLDAELVRQADRADADDAKDRKERDGTAEQVDYHRISCAELDSTDYRLEYLIDNTLVAGQPCGLAGCKKTLKTSLLIDLGIALAMGGCFLGKLRVNRACRVGVMSGENGLATIQETARRICDAAGYRLADIGGLVFSDELPTFGSIDHQEAVERFISNDELEVLMIDPAYLCMPGADASNYFVQGELLRGMGETCAACGCMMVLAAHNRKNRANSFAVPELEDIAWAGFQEYFRQWLLVGRREQYKPGTGSHRLWLNVGGSAGHSKLWR